MRRDEIKKKVDTNEKRWNKEESRYKWAEIKKKVDTNEQK